MGSEGLFSPRCKKFNFSAQIFDHPKERVSRGSIFFMDNTCETFLSFRVFNWKEKEREKSKLLAYLLTGFVQEGESGKWCRYYRSSSFSRRYWWESRCSFFCVFLSFFFFNLHLNHSQTTTCFPFYSAQFKHLDTNVCSKYLDIKVLLF